MKFERPIIEGQLLKRYKRFFANIDVNGKTLLAHVPNSGSMKGCSDPQSKCRVSFVNDPSRKLQYTLEMVKTPSSWVGVNTSHPNKLVEEVYKTQAIKDWQSFDRHQREVKISDSSRVDLVLWSSKNFKEERLVKVDFKKVKSPFHFIEVKNVSLAEDSRALFPDSITERGQKHIDELVKLIQYGHTAEFVFVVQREDCKSFSPADTIDEVYGKKLRSAVREGLKVRALSCKLSEKEIELLPNELEVVL